MRCVCGVISVCISDVVCACVRVCVLSFQVFCTMLANNTGMQQACMYACKCISVRPSIHPPIRSHAMPCPALRCRAMPSHPHRQADRQTDRQTDKQKDRQTDRQTEHIFQYIYACMYRKFCHKATQKLRLWEGQWILRHSRNHITSIGNETKSDSGSQETVRNHSKVWKPWAAYHPGKARCSWMTLTSQ